MCDERVMCALDWVVAAAKARGLRLILTLTNYWPEYGGLAQYVRQVRVEPPVFPHQRALGAPKCAHFMCDNLVD